jgi:hypothetical protein
MTDIPPPARPHPKLARWLFDRKLSFRDVSKPFGCSHEYVRLICLPFDDPNRRVPTADVVERIHTYTAGEISPADHYPPHLRAEPALHAEPVP